MKKLKMLLWMCLFPFLLLAQISTVQNTVEQQPKPLTIHEYLYKARIVTIENQGLILTQNGIHYVFSSDTSWGFDEITDAESDDYTPNYFTQHFDIGDPTTFVRHTRNYEWNTNNNDWILTRRGMDYIHSDFIDSSISRYLDEFGTTVSGDYYTYLRQPTGGATSEYYYQRFESGTGWVPGGRSQAYSNEDNSIRWSKSYQYNSTSMLYDLSSEYNVEDTDNHYLFESKSYSSGEISYWSKQFTLYNQDGNAVHTTMHNLNTSTDALSPTDSTAYVYNQGFAAALGYSWNGTNWDLDDYTRTFESASSQAPNGIKIDSVVTYNLVYDAQLDSVVAGSVKSKTVWNYDQDDNMIENLFYNSHGGPLYLYIRSTFEYDLINGDHHPTLTRNYVYSGSLMDLYLNSENHNLRSPDGSMQGDINFYFSEVGDTTSGYKSLMYFEGDAFYTFSYQWMPMDHAFIQTGFTMHNEMEPVTQYTYNDSFGKSRSVYVLESLPAAINPGPLFLALGDTVDLIISASNPNMSMPTLTMTGLPVTATFNQTTRRLYWIVDEEVAGPFEITATNGSKSSTIEVKVVFGEFTVGIEDESELPVEITLYQNYPNPFNPSTTISFELSGPQNVTLTVFNILGQPVQILLDSEFTSTGLKEIAFDASSLSSGIYFYRLETIDAVFNKKMTLIK